MLWVREAESGVETVSWAGGRRQGAGAGGWAHLGFPGEGTDEQGHKARKPGNSEQLILPRI